MLVENYENKVLLKFLDIFKLETTDKETGFRISKIHVEEGKE